MRLVQENVKINPGLDALNSDAADLDSQSFLLSF